MFEAYETQFRASIYPERALATNTGDAGEPSAA